MFTDGVLYVAIAHNLSRGMGSFWQPYFSNTMFPFFHQQPPLTFGIQAIFFKVFGDSLYVERGYSFLTLLISAYLISYLWKEIHAENENLKNISWLPVIFWIITPTCIWSYSNNMEENTMGIFTLLSVIFTYKGLTRPRKKIAFLIVGGIAASLAFLCKGFPGLFVIVFPFLYWICFRSFFFLKTLVYSFIIAGTIGCIYGILFISPDIRYSLFAYLNDRVVNSILHVSTEENRFFLLEKLFFVELLPPFFLCIILWGLCKWKSVFNPGYLKSNRKAWLLFLLIGISASFPLTITKEQREFYLVPSLPYFAMAFAIFIGNGVAALVNRINIKSVGFKLFRLVSVIFFAGSFLYSVSLAGKVGRDKEQLHDIYIFGNIIPPKTTIRVYTETWLDWGLQNYLQRYFNISLMNDTSTTYRYFMVERSRKRIPPQVYSKIPLNTLDYDLYEKRK